MFLLPALGIFLRLALRVLARPALFLQFSAQLICLAARSFPRLFVLPLRFLARLALLLQPGAQFIGLAARFFLSLLALAFGLFPSLALRFFARPALRFELGLQFGFDACAFLGFLARSRLRLQTRLLFRLGSCFCLGSRFRFRFRFSFGLRSGFGFRLGSGFGFGLGSGSGFGFRSGSGFSLGLCLRSGLRRGPGPRFRFRPGTRDRFGCGGFRLLQRLGFGPGIGLGSGLGFSLDFCLRGGLCRSPGPRFRVRPGARGRLGCGRRLSFPLRGVVGRPGYGRRGRNPRGKVEVHIGVGGGARGWRRGGARGWRRGGLRRLREFPDKVVPGEHIQCFLQLGLRHLAKPARHFTHRDLAIDRFEDGAHVARQSAGSPGRLHQAFGGFGEDCCAIHAASVLEQFPSERLIIGNPRQAG